MRELSKMMLSRIRAGVLEQGMVNMLEEAGVEYERIEIGPEWFLLGKEGSAASDDDDPFTDAGRAAVAAAQRAAVPPGLHATWESAKARRPGAAKIAANETVAEQVQTAECSETALPLGCCNGCPLTHRFDRLETQVHLIACDMDRRGWAPLHHKHYPHRFRAVVQTLLLGTKCPASALSLLSDDVVHHLVAKLALRWYWELT